MTEIAVWGILLKARHRFRVIIVLTLLCSAMLIRPDVWQQQPLGAQSGIEQKSSSETHAIIDMRQGCLTGAVQDHRWLSTAQLGRKLRGTHKFSFYTLDGPVGDITATITLDRDCEGTWRAESRSKFKAGIGIASPQWEVMPRIPRAIDRRDTTYLKIVGDILKTAGLRNPKVNITEGYKIDLDGDGKDEVVLIATNFVARELSGLPQSSAPGDYTLVLVRKIIDETVRNVFLVKDIRLKEHDGGLPRGYHLSAIGDFNGDGVMEIALYSAYYEGSGTDIIETTGTKPKGVLWCGCEH